MWMLLVVSVCTTIALFQRFPTAYGFDYELTTVENAYDDSDTSRFVLSTHGDDSPEPKENNSRTLNQSTVDQISSVSSFAQRTPKTIDNTERKVGDNSQINTGDSVADFLVEQNSHLYEDNVISKETVNQSIGGDFVSKISSDWFASETGLFGRDGIVSSLKAVLIMSVVAIAPAFLLMTTSYVRISIVLFLLRQALGLGQIPSNQVLATLAVFLTALVMSPVAVEIYEQAVVPYSESQISRTEAFQKGQEPVRTFLWKQIERTGNTRMISLFTKYLPDVDEPKYIEDVPWRALAPAFLLSELKTSFLIGFQIFLPFLIIDFVVSCVLVSTGMMMLPPAIVSLPLKLALFVMIDGWALVVRSLVESFA